MTGTLLHVAAHVNGTRKKFLCFSHASLQVGVSKWTKKLETVFYNSSQEFDLVRRGCCCGVVVP